MDDDLSTLLHDAVADVEPTDRLDDLRARTAVPGRSTARPWFYAVGATALATAATIAAFAVLGGDGGDHGPDPARHDDRSTQERTQVPAYYPGETPEGLRLFREFDDVVADDPLDAALVALQRDPVDPDYRTLWEPDSFSGAGFDGRLLTIDLVDDSLRERPDGMNASDARQAIQQVVYTLQGTVQDRAPVQFLIDGDPADRVYGVPTPDPLETAPQAQVLAPVNISDPAEDAVVRGIHLRARGRAMSWGGNVWWEVRHGGVRVLSGLTDTSGPSDRLSPWEAEIDVSALQAGADYVLIVRTDDSRTTDTRTFSVAEMPDHASD